MTKQQEQVYGQLSALQVCEELLSECAALSIVNRLQQFLYPLE